MVFKWAAQQMESLRISAGLRLVNSKLPVFHVLVEQLQRILDVTTYMQ